MKISISNSTDEAYLVSCCRKGDEQARKILYMKYVEEMLLLCLRYIKEKEDAREVLMDAFLKFFNNIDDFEYRGEGSVRAWLKKITISYCLMFLRKRAVLFDQINDNDFYQEMAAADDVTGMINAKEIMKLIHTLPDGCRTVFNMYVFEEMTHKDIALMLNISEGTSKSQLHLARKLLKEKIMINI